MVPVALGLIFFVLFATLGSVRQALLILANIPFALIGGVIALWAVRRVSLGAGLGRLHRPARHRGAQRPGAGRRISTSCSQRAWRCEQVVYDGARRRLRPVLMTASIAALGLVPLLFADGPGSEIQKPLAIVVIGGLITSTVLTLVLLPILYRRFGAAEARP